VNPESLARLRSADPALWLVEDCRAALTAAEARAAKWEAMADDAMEWVPPMCDSRDRYDALKKENAG
jgi:hypothetical protein